MPGHHVSLNPFPITPVPPPTLKRHHRHGTAILHKQQAQRLPGRCSVRAAWEGLCCVVLSQTQIQTVRVAIKGRQRCCKLVNGRVLSVHKTSSCLLPRIWTELFKHMLHPRTVISVSQQSVAEQLVKTYCSVNCIGMQMPSHL